VGPDWHESSGASSACRSTRSLLARSPVASRSSGGDRSVVWASWHPVTRGLWERAGFSRRLRSRQIAGRERVGRFARAMAWDLVASVVRRAWPVLIGVMLLPAAAGLPFFFLLEHGSARWIFLGALAVSGPRLDVLITTVLSGASDTSMGLGAEGDIADELRRLRREGWRLANEVSATRLRWRTCQHTNGNAVSRAPSASAWGV
jgi:hypothetical protein